jgi:FtsH-binding integral membrane protein
MSDYNNGSPWGGAIPAKADMSVDAGLRAFMLGVYNKLALGLLLAGALAYVTGNVPQVTELFYRTTADGRFAGSTPLGLVVTFAPLAMLLISSFAMRNPTAGGANLLYWAVVATMGASLGYVFLLYAGASVYTAFFVTAASFAGLSLWGYTTKRDLGPWGSFLMMGLFGIIFSFLALMLVSWLAPATAASAGPAVMFVINVVSVLVFAGFIAYDTQWMKMTYYQVGDAAGRSVLTSYAALRLFINFINLFLTLLRIFGNRR